MYKFILFYWIFIRNIEMYKINNAKHIFSGYDMRPITTENIKLEKEALLHIQKNMIKKEILRSLESKHTSLNDKMNIIKNNDLFPIDYVGDINAGGLFKDFEFDFDFDIKSTPK
jgi:hypothetical protein